MTNEERKVIEPEQQPVGKFAKFTDGIWREVTDGSAGVSLYITPPQRTWVGLTDEEIDSVFQISAYQTEPIKRFSPERFALAIEQALKEKNT